MINKQKSSDAYSARQVFLLLSQSMRKPTKYLRVRKSLLTAPHSTTKSLKKRPYCHRLRYYECHWPWKPFACNTDLSYSRLFE
jgi:hypothetical protein